MYIAFAFHHIFLVFVDSKAIDFCLIFNQVHLLDTLIVCNILGEGLKNILSHIFFQIILILPLTPILYHLPLPFLLIHVNTGKTINITQQ